MMTVITRVKLKAGAENEWDEAMRERLKAAQDQQGWLGGQLLVPAEGRNERAIVGIWQDRSHWESWHDDPAFKETRERMEGLQEAPDDMEWFDVVAEESNATA